EQAERAEAASARAREERAAAARLVEELTERLAATRAALAQARSEAESRAAVGEEADATDLGAVRGAFEAARAELEAARQAKEAADAAVASGRHEREMLAERWAAHAAALQRLERARLRLDEIGAELELVAREREATSEELASAAWRLEAVRAELPAGVDDEEKEEIGRASCRKGRRWQWDQ